MQTSTDNRITEQQLDLLKSFQYLRNEQDIAEVRELLKLYFEKKLDATIENVENERNYTQEVYDEWLSRSSKKSA